MILLRFILGLFTLWLSAIGLVISIAAILYFGSRVYPDTWRAVEQFKFAPVVLDGGNIWALDGADSQIQFINVQKFTYSKFNNRSTDSQKKAAWINASRYLCSKSSGFNFNQERIDWIGKIYQIKSLNDKDTLRSIDVVIDPYGTKANAILRKTDRLFNSLNFFNEMQTVRISGFFKKGDLRGDNECFDLVNFFDDQPEFSGDRLSFKLTKLEPLNCRDGRDSTGECDRSLWTFVKTLIAEIIFN